MLNFLAIAKHQFRCRVVPFCFLMLSKTAIPLQSGFLLLPHSEQNTNPAAEWLPSAPFYPSIASSITSHRITSHCTVSLLQGTKSSTVAQFHYLILRLTLGVKRANAPKVCGPYKHEIGDSCTVSLLQGTKLSTVVQFHYLILRLTLGVKRAGAPKVCGPYKHEIVDSCKVSLPYTEAHSGCQKGECSKSVRPLQARNRRQLQSFTTSY